MYQPLQTCFRRDLVIDEVVKAGVKSYRIKDPASGETFEFGEEEFFLCQLMDGALTPRQIIEAFEARFGLKMSEEDFEPFCRQIGEYGLLERYSERRQTTATIVVSEAQPFAAGGAFEDTGEPGQGKKPKSDMPYKWYYPELAPVFVLFARLLEPFHLLFKLAFLLLIPTVPLTLITILNNQILFFQDFSEYYSPIDGLTKHMVNILVVNSISKVAQAVVASHYGVAVEQFGLQMLFGFFPRFTVGKGPLFRQLTREQQIWTFATPILVRLLLFVLGGLTWYLNHGSTNSMSAWAVSLCYMAFVDTVLDSNPLWPSDAYGVVVAYYRLPPSLFKRNRQIVERLLRLQWLPDTIPLGDRLRMTFFALVGEVVWLAFFAYITLHSAEALQKLVPDLLGEGLGILLFCLPFPFAIHWWLLVRDKTRTSKKASSSSPLGSDQAAITPAGKPDHLQLPEGEQANLQLASQASDGILEAPGSAPPRFGGGVNLWEVFRKGLPWLVLAAFVVILMLPYTYHYGGAIQLLPPRQQPIAVEVEGVLDKLYFKGGDQKLIKAGTTLALLRSVDTQNQVNTGLSDVRTREAALITAQEELRKLLSMPRPEEVQVARDQVSVARQEVSVAKSQLVTAKSKADFSAREAERNLKLSKEGVVSDQVYENAKREAETERIGVETAQESLASAGQRLEQAQSNLRLVMAGPHPQEISAARSKVEQERAELKRVQDQYAYYRQQLNFTKVVMPFNGYIITPNLDWKVGSRMQVGDVLGVAQHASRITGTIQMPEYQAGDGFKPGGEVEVKLWAYPTRSFAGKVASIEPVATSYNKNDPQNVTKSVEYGADPTELLKSTTRYVNVVVDFPQAKAEMKPGMTGYAKVTGETQPVFQAFSHPLVRFVTVELWSWLP
ncbi:HlyD family secretion protein [Gloeobacter violaceus]|nr:hypothetical protein [Gloeobacter violaceus]